MSSVDWEGYSGALQNEEAWHADSGDINSRDLAYYLSGMSNDARLKGIIIGIASRLQPSVVKVTPVDVDDDIDDFNVNGKKKEYEQKDNFKKEVDQDGLIKQKQ